MGVMLTNIMNCRISCMYMCVPIYIFICDIYLYVIFMFRNKLCNIMCYK